MTHNNAAVATHSRITVELYRDEESGNPVLGLFDLKPEHFEVLETYMLQNGEGEIYTKRSHARAHIEYWDRAQGLVEIIMYGEEMFPFTSSLCAALGVPPESHPSILEL